MQLPPKVLFLLDVLAWINVGLAVVLLILCVAVLVRHGDVAAARHYAVRGAICAGIAVVTFLLLRKAFRGGSREP